MSAYDALPPLREVIAKHDLNARKSLGQNFLLDLNLTAKITRLAGNISDTTVLEVGSGPGGLTRALLKEGAKHVIAVEKDARCLPALQEIAAQYPERLTIVEGDALQCDLVKSLPSFKVVANLPYNVGTELLIRWLCWSEWPPAWSSLTLMFQKEVAERIIAQPGTKAYGRLSVLAQWRSQARIVMNVGPQAFTPPPKISSAVVHIEPLPEPILPVSLKTLEHLTQLAFSQRRKMLRQSLKSLPYPLEDLLQGSFAQPTDRPETLSVRDFCQIAKNLEEFQKNRREQ